jgi:hypothetical protein
MVNPSGYENILPPPFRVSGQQPCQLPRREWKRVFEKEARTWGRIQ